MRTLGVIMAGGKGERFWPLSREKHPKQFLKIKGDKELIENTFERIKKGFDEVLIVTTRVLENKVKERFPGVKVIAEPIGKNTAPCAAISTKFAKEHGFDIVALFPADHYIDGIEGFLDNVRVAINMAERGFISTIGIKPTRPDTGFGYIERGASLEKGVYRVLKFHEKPDRGLAESYLESGRFYWNAGMFFWRVDIFFSELEKHAPDIFQPIDRYDLGDIETIYMEVPSISIDYALLEKTDKTVVVESKFFWEDLGSYLALERVIDKDENENIIIGDAALLDANGNIVVAQDGIVAALGVENIVIVHTKDVTLVLPKERSQEVKRIVKLLREQNKEQYL